MNGLCELDYSERMKLLVKGKVENDKIPKQDRWPLGTKIDCIPTSIFILNCQFLSVNLSLCITDTCFSFFVIILNSQRLFLGGGEGARWGDVI